jgi:hypothetical protein
MANKKNTSTFTPREEFTNCDIHTIDGVLLRPSEMSQDDIRNAVAQGFGDFFEEVKTEEAPLNDSAE